MAALSASTLAEETHWAFRPLERPAVPEGITDPVSWLVLERRAALSGQPAEAPTAVERRVWIRRLYYNLVGLPPSYGELENLLASHDSEEHLANRLVEELLASPRYGERWARHWLDVARYSDTKGYAYSPEEFSFPHAWPYRDWVIRAFNEDLPYDQFVQRQLAADLLLERKLCDRGDLAAMGFLTLGRRFIGVEPDIIDDRIDVVTRGLLGLTVSCARCHDHKFDPIPTADYYALYGVFKSSREELRALDPEQARGHAELVKKKEAMAAELETQAAQSEQRFLARAADYILAARDLSKVPPPDFSEILQKDDLYPAQIRRMHEYLSQTSRRDDPVFGPWLALLRGEAAEFPQANLPVKEALRAAAGDVSEAARLLAALLHRAAGEEGESEETAWRQLRHAVHGPGSPFRIPREYVHDVEWLFDTDANKTLKQRLAEYEREIIKLGEQAPHALILVDRPDTQNVRVFERGNYCRQLEEVPRGSLAVLHGGKRPAFREGSGRLALAREITSQSNPLTARVFVNRIWRAHFGEGLVRTESDFGLRSEPPGNPALLDFLAAELMDNGWSIKHVQRLIANSEIYRSTIVPRRRLDFEAMRDSMLAESGELDLRMGGPPGELLGLSASPRRSVYGRIDRQFLPSTLLVFDFANPELHSPRRFRTNVPQQALFLMNAPFTVARARALAGRVAKELPEGDAASKIERFFQHVYGRNPAARELESSLQFVTGTPDPAAEELSDPAAEAWSYGYGTFEEKSGRLASFRKLLHFDGNAWGGSAAWPDGALGWLRLTAQGGHAGNKVEHAAVRRWTAPMAGTFHLTGSIAKIEECGDGLRAWVSSNRRGLLGAWEIEFGKPAEAQIEEIEVAEGETLDFVIDCGAANNFFCDGFTWAPKLRLAGSDRVWDAHANFAGKITKGEELDVWIRLAQALLISNEAMFVD